jgi:hypothetical protein
MSGTATNGTDYNTISSPITIAAGVSYVDITLTPINDTTPEGDETAILTISTNAAYTVGSPSSATITIQDDDKPTLTVTATDNTATESPLTTGYFTVSRTGSTSAALTVYYSVGGTATAGSDYNSLPGSITIPAGSSTATITVTPINDALVESDETVIVTLNANAGYTIGSPSSATVTIISDDQSLPDLFVSSLTGPTTPVAPGQVINLSEATKNQGSVATTVNTVTKFFWSTNATYDASDVLLGQRTVGPLAAGGISGPVSTSVTISITAVSGTYYIIAVADAGSAVSETYETNNTRYMTVTVSP